MSDSTDVLAEIDEGLEEHAKNCAWAACSPSLPCAVLRALTGWKKAEERAQQWETATGVALNREHAEQQRRFKAVEEKTRLQLELDRARSVTVFPTPATTSEDAALALTEWERARLARLLDKAEEERRRLVKAASNAMRLLDAPKNATHEYMARVNTEAWVILREALAPAKESK